MKELEAEMGAAEDAAVLEYKKGEVRVLQVNTGIYIVRFDHSPPPLF